MSYLKHLLNEFTFPFNNYYRERQGEINDSRPVAAKMWSETVGAFPPSEIEAQDMAAVMSACVRVEKETRKELLFLFKGVSSSNESQIMELLEQAGADLTIGSFQFEKDHPVKDYFVTLLESDDGRTLLVNVALCLTVAKKQLPKTKVIFATNKPIISEKE